MCRGTGQFPFLSLLPRVRAGPTSERRLRGGHDAQGRTPSLGCLQRLRGCGNSLGLREWTGPLTVRTDSLARSPRPRCTLALLLSLLLPLGPAWHAAAQRCPQTCVCDNSRRYVSCRHQNITEVPKAIPEVSRAGGAGGAVGTAGGAWAQWVCPRLAGDLGKSVFLSEPQSPHLQNGNDNPQ